MVKNKEENIIKTHKNYQFIKYDLHPIKCTISQIRPFWL